MEEKMYLVCECGEAFDEIAIAGHHVCEFNLDVDPPVFTIKPESEAM